MGFCRLHCYFLRVCGFSAPNEIIYHENTNLSIQIR
jgi:hypothetical protein